MCNPTICSAATLCTWYFKVKGTVNSRVQSVEHHEPGLSRCSSSRFICGRFIHWRNTTAATAATVSGHTVGLHMGMYVGMYVDYSPLYSAHCMHCISYLTVCCGCCAVSLPTVWASSSNFKLCKLKSLNLR
jgi:hypothetical protein